MPSGAPPQVRRRKLGLGEVESLAATGSGPGGISVDDFLDAAGTHLEVSLLEYVQYSERGHSERGHSERGHSERSVAACATE